MIGNKLDVLIPKYIKTLVTSTPEQVETLASPEISTRTDFTVRDWYENQDGRISDRWLVGGYHGTTFCAPLAVVISGPKGFDASKSPFVEIEQSKSHLVQWANKLFKETNPFPRFISMNNIAEARILGNFIHLEAVNYHESNPFSDYCNWLKSDTSDDQSDIWWTLDRKTQSTLPKGEYVIKFSYIVWSNVCKCNEDYTESIIPSRSRLLIPQREEEWMSVKLNLNSAKVSGSNRNKKSDSEKWSNDSELER